MLLASGTQFGPYEILDLLGTGGMGEVYHARDHRLGRTVAIKILLAAREASPAQLERFRREARSIGRLSHPHICTLHDVGEQDGVPYLVMEYLDGETLAERLERGPIPIERARLYAVQIAEALGALHERDVIHRDLKPSNVMLTAGGAKLLDFGLAKLRDGEYAEAVTEPTKSLSLTDPGSIVGTLPYMAPEQIEGQDVDTRTDIFSFGVVFYEMIAGRRPFTGETRAALMAAIVGAEPPSLQTIEPLVTRALERLIRRCLAKRNDDRWQTARDLAAELKGISEQAPEPATTVHAPVRVRRRAWIIGALVAAAGAGGVFAGRAMVVPRPATIAEYWPATYRRGVVSSARFSPDGQSLIYSASWEGRPYRVFLGGARSGDARDLGVDGARVLSISNAGDMALLFGPQNIQRAFGTRTLARIPMAGGARRDLLNGVVDADWIPGTNDLAVIRDPGGNRPWIVEFPIGTPVHETRAAWSIRVSPDGNRVAFFEGPAVFDSVPEGMVTVVERSGQKSTLSKGWTGLGLAWTPTGDEIWFTGTHGGVADPANTTNESRGGPPWLQAVSLSGVERTVHRAPDWLVLHDISRDGQVLLARNTIRMEMACRRPSDESERDLSWLYSSLTGAISLDGETVIFHDVLGGRTPSGNPTVFRRNLDGSPAIPLGEGLARALSPDKKWVLAQLQDDLVLLPMGAGANVTLPKGGLRRVAGGAWLDATRIVFLGIPDDNQPRGYVQEIPDGAPRAITPPGVVLAFRAAVHDNSSVLGQLEGQWRLYPTAGGEPTPVRALSSNDVPVQWSDDGRFMYAMESVSPPGRPSRDVYRVELATGKRVLWKTLGPRDAVGVEATAANIAIAPNGQSYCYSFTRRLGDLFIATGLQ